MRFQRLHPSIPTEIPSFHSLTLFAFVLLLTPHSTHALWPQPRSLQNGTSALRLAPSFTITVAVPNAPADLLAAAQRTHARLFADKLARLEPTHGAADLPALSRANVLPGLTLRLEGDGVPEWGVRRVAEEACAAFEARREGYSLDVPADGSGAVLSAASTLGLFRGLNTFAQLWYYYYRCARAAADGIGGSGNYALGEGEDAPLGAGAGACDGSSSEMVYTLMAPVMIKDSPAYVRHGRDYPLPVESWTDLGDGDSRIAGSCWTPRETCTSSRPFFRPEMN
jgi:hexosaminidase